MNTKKCASCGSIKDVSEFPSGKNADGLSSYCYRCMSERAKQYYSKNKQKVLQYQEKYRENNKEKISSRDKKYRKENKKILSIKKSMWAKSESGKACSKKSQKKHANCYPDKYKAVRKINNALRDGRIIRPSVCSVCGIECVPP